MAIKRAKYHSKLQKFVLILITLVTQENNTVEIVATMPQMILLRESVVLLILQASEQMKCAVLAVEE